NDLTCVAVASTGMTYGSVVVLGPLLVPGGAAPAGDARPNKAVDPAIDSATFSLRCMRFSHSCFRIRARRPSLRGNLKVPEPAEQHVLQLFARRLPALHHDFALVTNTAHDESVMGWVRCGRGARQGSTPARWSLALRPCAARLRWLRPRTGSRR